jgi:hypothetical protein
MQNSLHRQFVLRGGYAANPDLRKAVGSLLIRFAPLQETLMEG